MSVLLNNVAVTAFQAEVKHLYQAEGANLTTLCRTRSITGKDASFPIYGKAIANEHLVGSDVKAQNTSRTPVVIAVKNFESAEYSNTFLQAQVNHDEVAEIAKMHMMAMKRRADQEVINALNASTTSLAVAADISGSTTDLTVDALRRAAMLLNRNNVPSEGRILLCHASGINNLLADDKITSADFNSLRALVQGQLDTFMGFRIVMIGDYDEGGLPKTGANRTSFAFHRNAVGCAVSVDMRSEVNYIPQKASVLTAVFHALGAKELDASGIVKITTQEAV